MVVHNEHCETCSQRALVRSFPHYLFPRSALLSFCLQPHCYYRYGATTIDEVSFTVWLYYLHVIFNSQALPRHARNNVLRKALGRRRIGKAERAIIVAETKKRLDGKGACVVSLSSYTLAHSYLAAFTTAPFH